MKKVGLITTTLRSGHSIRGIGFYTRGLLSELKNQSHDFDIEIIETDKPSTKLDLVHYPFFDLFSHTLPLYRSTKAVVTVHDVIPLQFPAAYPPGIMGTKNLLLQKLALNSVSAVITDSQSSVGQIHQHLSVPYSKIKLVYLAPAPGIQKTSNFTCLKKFNLPKKFILCVNDVNYNKNIVNLIKASQSLKIPLVLVGKQAAELENMDLNHPELIHLKEILPYLDSSLLIRPGFVKDEELSALYSQASVYCHPSLAEGFGIGVANALVCGCPVVCSNCSSLPEIAGDAAVYVDPTSLDSIASGINQVLLDTKLRLQLIKAGESQIKKFTWADTALHTLQVYRQALQS